MVKLKEQSFLLADGSINIDAWLQEISKKRKSDDIALIRHACVLSQLAGEDHITINGTSCLHKGLAMADILVDLQLDKETLAAAIVYNNVHYSDLSIDDVREHLGDGVAKLVDGVAQLDAIPSLQSQQAYQRSQIENLRKMLLAMVQDVRVVLIKLAERTSIMRSADALSETKQQQIAKETMDIFAPLANRLGVGQLKWELEDLAFRFLERETYKKLAKLLDEKRISRERYVQNLTQTIKDELKKAHLKDFEVTGRVKHIYSIYRKMLRKQLDYDHIYDVRAVRILVQSIEDCYSALGVIHTLWPHIQEEFDDYIATPKENGYRSIHTVIIGPNNKNVEVQIRTQQMHQEAELGVAAHWVYKEGMQQKSGYEGKINWLRQVLEWQKGLAISDQIPNQIHPEIFADRVYVFTPTGDIVDLPQGATPLDFAYHIHSEVGHRCRGAKVNGNIVNLTHILSTGEKVEILTTREANPSRDWLNPHLGYLKSSRARAKVHHWFKQQDFDKNLAEGQTIFEKELRKLNLQNIDQEKIAQQLNFKASKDMLAALGCNDIRFAQILNAIQVIQPTLTSPTPEPSLTLARPTASSSTTSGITIEGVGNLLTHIAHCCQPVPGDKIIGFITQGHGVSIHRGDCSNILHLNPANRPRLIEVQWGTMSQEVYPANIFVTAYDRQGLLRDITILLSNEKINLINANSVLDKTSHMVQMTLTLEINSLSSLSKILDKINHLPNVIGVERR